MRRDIFGRLRYVQDDDIDPVPYETDSTTVVAGDKTTVTTYIRYYDAGSDPCGIQRHVRETTGSHENIKIMFAFAKWADREDPSTVYVPINDCWKR